MPTLRKFLIHLLNKIPSKRIFTFYFSKINTSNFGMVMALHRVTLATAPIKEASLNNFIEITDKNLEKTILNLIKLDVQFISLDELCNALKQDSRPSRPLVHLSFDDGYADNFKVAYPILKKYNIPFSVFIVSDFIDKEHPFLWWYMIEAIINQKHPVSFEKFNFSIKTTDYQSKDKGSLFEEFRSFILQHLDNDNAYFEETLGHLIREISGSNIPEMLSWKQLKIMHESGLCDIGIHTSHHVRFGRLNMEEKREEIMDCKEAIIHNTGVIPKYFSYPYGSPEDIGNTKGLADLLMDCGIEAAFTTVAGKLNGQCNPFFIPRVFINNTTTNYTLQSRLNGSYQRGEMKGHLDSQIIKSDFEWDI